MVFSWRVKRQLLFLAIFLIVLGGVLWALFSWVIPAPTCSDKRQNQSEEGVDCGGPCAICIKNTRDPIILWTRFFEVSPGHFEVAALVENVNSNFGARNISYRFRLYDSKNILIAAREGKTFINPNERFLVFNPDIPAFERVPVRATLEFNPIAWSLPVGEKPQIVITGKEFKNNPTGRVHAKFFNEGLFAVEDIVTAAVLLDANGNAMGASMSEIASIQGEQEKDIFFTWRASYEPPPSKVEIFWRVNILEE